MKRNYKETTMPHRSNPIIAKKDPYPVTFEAGKSYWWCACGHSKTQPFCDGSHKGTTMEPIQISVKETKTVALCGCKHTKNAPFCDRAHSKL